MFPERIDVSRVTQEKRLERNGLSAFLSLCTEDKRRVNLLSILSLLGVEPIVCALLSFPLL